MRRTYHLAMMWICLGIGMLFKHENWFSEQSAVHWLKSRRFFQ